MKKARIDHPGRVSFALWCVFLGTLGFAFSLPAHEQKSALTDLFYNERTGNLEIAHRFSIHDAEHTLRKAMDLQADLIGSTKDQGLFAEYVADRFQLIDAKKNPIPLTLVGQELEGGYLWIYQETRISGHVALGYYVKNSVLMDVVEGQINTVNVRDQASVSTFVFDSQTGPGYYRRGTSSVERN